MEAEAGGKAADAGQPWGEGKAGEHCGLRASCLIHFKDNKTQGHFPRKKTNTHVRLTY